MFSAADMSELSREVLGGGELLSISSLLDNDWLVKIFTEGKQLLIPYDCAANHSPCLEERRRIAKIFKPLEEEDIKTLKRVFPVFVE